MAVVATVNVWQKCYDDTKHRDRHGAPVSVWQALNDFVQKALKANRLPSVRAFGNANAFMYGLPAHDKLVVFLFSPFALQQTCPHGLEPFLGPLYLHVRYGAIVLQHRYACCVIILVYEVLIAPLLCSFSADEASMAQNLWKAAVLGYQRLLDQVQAGQFHGITDAVFTWRGTPNTHLGAHYAWCIARHGPPRGVSVFVWETLIGGTTSCAALRFLSSVHASVSVH